MKGIKSVSTARFAVLVAPGDNIGDVEPKQKKLDAVKLPVTKKNEPKPEAVQEKKPSSSESKAKKSKNTEKTPQREWTNEMQQDFDRMFSVGEECISSEELKQLVIAKGRGSGSDVGIALYDGFEPSGRMHIAQGVFKAMNVNKCTYPGTNSTFVFWVADWFALMNDKMGGDLEKIKTVGKYLIEVWKAAGMDLSNVVFKWASEEITQQADTYWPTMLDVARRFTISRIKKCCQIMGRLEGSLTAAQVLYPLMQCTDIFFLKADICQLGVDQRKVNMLAREYCDAARIKHKPVILSHHMLYGLKAGQEKMSKSDPDSAVFMEDSAEDVRRKIMNAYCPSSEVEASNDTNNSDNKPTGESMHLVEDALKNPCLDYVENIIFSAPDSSFSVDSKTFTKFADVRSAFVSNEISEEQLKEGLILKLNEMLDPVRSHFNNDENAKQLLELVHKFKREASTNERSAPRLDLPSLGKVPKDSHLVFAPQPSANPLLQDAIDTLFQLRQGKDRPCVLFLSDWSARVCNCCNADEKAIDAYFKVFVKSLTSIDPETMKSVKVLYQSEAILLDPSNYWLNVINVGRHFMLDKVMGDIGDSDGVGNVIDRLMKVSDIAGVAPQSISLPDKQSSVLEYNMIDEFFRNKLVQVQVPKESYVCAPSIRLQQPKENEAVLSENDEFSLLDDPKVNVKSKLKKSFCEPGNVDFCPPISLVSVFVFALGTRNELSIKRSPENGGDVNYTEAETLKHDFSMGEQCLHPGDLKGAVLEIVMDVMNRVADGIKSDADATKAVKTLKDFKKKSSKSKK